MRKERLVGDGERRVNKRGLTSSQIVLIVLAVAGFAIVIWAVVANLNLSTSTQDEVCELSALSRATTPSAVKSFIPLKCITKKVCITDGTGNCENYFAAEKEVKYVKIPVLTMKSSDKEIRAAAKILEKTQVEELYRCWKLLGEGKLDIFPQSFFTQYGYSAAKASCVVCSRVALDNKIINNSAAGKLLSYVNVDNYMATTQVEGSGYTYLEMMSDKGVTNIPSIDSSVFQKAYDDAKANLALTPGGTQIAFVFSQLKGIASPGEALKNVGTDVGLLVGGAILSKPSLGVSAAKFIFTLKGGVIALGIAGVGAGTTALAAWHNQGTSIGTCKQMTGLEDKEKLKNGCTVVQGIPYSIPNLNAVCPQIEGTP